MTSLDYVRAAGSGPGLVGAPTQTHWDLSLGEAMRQIGYAVMEERLLDSLLADLTP